MMGPCPAPLPQDVMHSTPIPERGVLVLTVRWERHYLLAHEDRLHVERDCRTVILRAQPGGTIRITPHPVLWEQHYPFSRSTPGGLAEAHAHIVARVRAGDLPSCTPP